MTSIAIRLSAIVLGALSLGLSFAHVLEMPPRLLWPPELWMSVTNFASLYWLFGRVGAAVDLGAFGMACALVYVSHRNRAACRRALLGAVLLLAGLGLWGGIVAPANAVMAVWTPGSVPPDFAAIRNRWEAGHAAVAAAKLVGFVLLVLAVVPEAGSSTPPPSERLPG